MKKEDEIMNFLNEKVFNPILDSKNASKELKAGVRLSIMRLKERDARGMIQYFWAAMLLKDIKNKISYVKVFD